MRPFAAAVFVVVASCRPHEPAPGANTRDPAEAIASAPAPSAQAPVAGEDADVESPATVERIAVAHDSLASVVRGKGGAAPHIVLMPGLCSNAYAYLLSFPEAARAHGGVVAIDGDQPCDVPGGGFHSFSWDPAKHNARVEAALAAAGVPGDAREGLTLVGYSSGASIGELMVQRWPRRYVRAVLIAAPSDPQVAHLTTARAVVTMSCSRDVPVRMRDAARRLNAAGVRAMYLEMPGCTHGNVAEGERVFGEAFDWVEGEGG